MLLYKKKNKRDKITILKKLISYKKIILLKTFLERVYENNKIIMLTCFN